MIKTYEPEIDGLRAISVVAVILFHLGIAGISGGFVGVDVFFVISGYLITRNIVIARSENRFSFYQFYKGRFIRLFPAFFTICAVSLLLGLLLLTPKDLMDLGNSLIYALFFSANLYFWQHTDYFATTSESRPSLHLWSLGVEEQFYFVWPLLIVSLLLFPRRYFVYYLLAIGLVSAVITGLYTKDHPTTAFYLMPFRVSEFVAGAVAGLLKRPEKPSRLNSLLFVTGIAAIFYSIHRFKPDMVFPGWVVLVPSLGAAAALYASGNTPLSRFLASPLFRWTGLLSYSLYLVHWPVFVFYRYWKIDPAITTTEKFLLLLLTLAGAWALYHFIENPIRRSPKMRALSLPAITFRVAAASALVILVSTYVIKENGFPKRSNLAFAESKHTCIGVEGIHCIVGSPTAPPATTLILGDSHAMSLLPLFTQTLASLNLKANTNIEVGCPPMPGNRVYMPNKAKAISVACNNKLPDWEKLLANPRYDTYIIAARWEVFFNPENYLGGSLQRTILIDPEGQIEDQRALFERGIYRIKELARQHGARVIFFSQIPRSRGSMDRCFGIPRLLINKQHYWQACADTPYDSTLAQTRYFDDFFDSVADENTLVIKPSEAFCPPGENACLASYQGNILYIDSTHLSLYGARYLHQFTRQALSDFLKPAQLTALNTGVRHQ